MESKKLIFEEITKHNKYTNNKMFNIYLVGGAVRDTMLKKEVNDYDWAVEINEGYSSEEVIEWFISNGFEKVGKSFPVFLEPITKEEYAFCRKEKKEGKGHNGFTVEFEKVSIKEDLKRRDLTINAIAYDVKNKEIINPYSDKGEIDILEKRLRPTSEAFKEDPLRFIRLARFATRFNDFKIEYKEFEELLTEEIKEEIFELSKERIWKELEKVLEEDNVKPFFNVLEVLGLEKVIPKYNISKVSNNLKDYTKEEKFALIYMNSINDKHKLNTKEVKIPKKYIELTNAIVKLKLLLNISNNSNDLDNIIMVQHQCIKKSKIFKRSILESFVKIMKKEYNEDCTNILNKYNYLEKHKKEWTPTKELIESFKVEGKIDLSKKEEWIFFKTMSILEKYN